MNMVFRRLFAFLTACLTATELLLATAPHVFAQAPGCGPELEQLAQAPRYELRLGQEVIDGREVSYFYTSARGVKAGAGRQVFRAGDILPEVNESDKLIIGFDYGHTYLYYDGYRIDSSGQAPFLVRSLLRESTALNGQFVVAIKDLSVDAKQRISAFIENFKTRSSRSCIMLTCTYLQKTLPELDLPRTYSPHRFLKQLLEAKAESPEKIEFVLLGYDSLKGQKDFLKQYVTNQYVVAGAYTAFFLPIPITIINGLLH